MNENLMDAACNIARENCKAAETTTFKMLSSRFPDAGFDTVAQAARQAVELHHSATALARKIWARMLPYAKAEEILSRQFPAFPAATRQRALNDANTEER
jgi:hypothetical protein